MNNIVFDCISILFSISGISIGVFLGIYFFRLKKENSWSNYIFSLIIFSISISLFSTILILTDLYIYLPHLVSFERFLLFFFPILIFLYVKSLTEINFKLSKKDLVHTIPLIICILYLIPFFIKSGEQKIEYINDLFNGKIFIYDMIHRFLFNIVKVIYTILILFKIKEYQKKIKNIYSTIDNINLNWIYYFFIFYFCIIILSIVLDFFMLFNNTQYIIFYRFLPVTTTVTFFILGYKGIIQQNIFVSIKTDINNVNEIIETQKIKKYLNKLLNLMKKEKPYINPDFTISQLSNKLSISDSKLVFIIKKYFNFDFYTFINNYRIEYAKDILVDEKFINSDLIEIANMCGFNSKNLFVKIFKQFTFISPEQFRIKAFSKFYDNKLLNFALFISNINNFYENSIYSGVKQYADEHSINLLCFVGSELNSPYYNRAINNEIYKLASIYSINGLIGISGTLKSCINKNELNEFYKKYYPLPIVSIGVELENDGSETICASNEREMHILINHLIQFHKYKNIAFILGSEKNDDSMIRLNIYKQVLKENNIPFNSDLIISGIYNPELGKEAVKILFDLKKLHVDAIVCVNDGIAINVIKELTLKGIMVPDDVAVVGFDDNKESKNMNPPLTTVRQPVFSLGYNAAKRLFSKIVEQDSNKKIVLPSKVCIRESCGCKSNYNKEKRINLITVNEKDLINYPEEFIDVFFQKILILILQESNHVSIGKGNEWSELLLKSFTDSLKKLEYKIFIESVKKILLESLIENMDIESWKNIFTVLFNSILNNTSDNEKNNFINELFKRTKKTLNDSDLLSNNEPVYTAKQSIRMQNLTNKFLQISEFNQLNQIIFEELPNFGVKSCYLSIYEKDDETLSNYFSKLIIAYEDYKMINLENKNIRFITRELIPGGCKNNKSNTYIIMPLNSEKENFGFIIYEVENVSIGILPFFTIQITNVLLSFDLYIKSNEKRQADENTESVELQMNVSKYTKSSLSKEKSDEYYKKLTDFMEKSKIYRNTELNLTALAEKINISAHNLSYLINEYAHFNFYDFINSYRINEVVTKLSNLSNKKISVLDIAYDSGFKSKSTFNKIFKKHTSMTPTQFIKKKNLNN